MKKQWILLISALLLLAVVGGMLSRKAGNNLSENEPLAMENVPSIGSDAGEQPETETAKEPVTDGNRVIRDYPDLNIKIDAVCPSETGVRNLTGVTAHISDHYFEQLLHDYFTSEFPDGKELKKDNWWCYKGDSQFVAYMIRDEFGSIGFNVHERDVNGVLETNHDYSEYAPVDLPAAQTLESTQDLGPFHQETAMRNAIHALEQYTDFDLRPINVCKETDGSNGYSWYRMRIELSYQKIPLSFMIWTPSKSNPSQLNGHHIGLDLGIGEKGIGYFEGSFSFDQIEESGSYHAMSLQDILECFEKYGYTYLTKTEDRSSEIYRIQLEYYPELGKNPGEYVFKPVWAFYVAEKIPDFGVIFQTLKLDAETGECRYYGGL